MISFYLLFMKTIFLLPILTIIYPVIFCMRMTPCMETEHVVPMLLAIPMCIFLGF